MPSMGWDIAIIAPNLQVRVMTSSPLPFATPVKRRFLRTGMQTVDQL